MTSHVSPGRISKKRVCASVTVMVLSAVAGCGPSPGSMATVDADLVPDAAEADAAEADAAGGPDTSAAADGCEARVDRRDACGACGRVCGDNERCLPQGETFTCVPCTAPRADRCGDRCVDLSDDPLNCGSCGTICAYPNGTGVCRAGQCVPGMCRAGYGDCTPEPGCETDLGTNQANCGACGASCKTLNGTGVCAGGTCERYVCNPGFDSCDKTRPDCETALNTGLNCGACGKVCTGQTPVCAAVDGALACRSGCPITAPSRCGSICANLQSDRNNCNACGRVCAFAHATAICEAGSCVMGTCDDGYADCDKDPRNGCEASIDTAFNCGACGRSCVLQNAISECVKRVCTEPRCVPGWASCDTRSPDCETSLGNKDNCGACGRVCGGDAPLCSAASGTAMCVPGCPPFRPLRCGNTCVDITADASHCGGCGQSCAGKFPGAASFCSGGQCRRGDPLDATVANPAVGQFHPAAHPVAGASCAATLISQRFFLTAAHCIGYAARQLGGAFVVTIPPVSPMQNPRTAVFAVSEVFSFDGNSSAMPGTAGDPLFDDWYRSGLGHHDLALGRLRDDVPAALAAPLVIADRDPQPGEPVTTFAYGCAVTNVPGSPGVKQYRSYAYPSTGGGCLADSGGPVVEGGVNGTGALLAIHSSQGMAGAPDIVALPGRLKTRIEALIRSIDDPSIEAPAEKVDLLGGDLPGNPLPAPTATGRNGCSGICGRNPWCRGFVYVPSTSSCFLKQWLPPATSDPLAISGALQYGLQVGIARGGPDLAGAMTAANAAVCRDRCTGSASCRAFTFVQSSGACTLKAAAGAATPSADAISGLSLTHGRFNYPMEDLEIIGNQTADGCEQECAARAECAAFSHTEISGDCALKKAVPTATSDCPSCISGARKFDEVGIDRPGADLAGMPVTQPSARACARACTLNDDCRAWSFVTARQQCRLKGFAVAPVAARGVVSGVRRGLEMNINRFGADIAELALAEPRPESCQRLCLENPACKSWTFISRPVNIVQTGFGTVNRCYLKDQMAEREAAVGFVSGRRDADLF